jgi:hypothetical protein
MKLITMALEQAGIGIEFINEQAGIGIEFINEEGKKEGKGQERAGRRRLGWRQAQNYKRLEREG